MATKIPAIPEKEIILIELGEAPDDRKGDVAQIFCAKVNSSLREIAYFLTGGAKVSGKLNIPLPITSGGTGAKTPNDFYRNMGLVTGHYGKLVRGTNAVKVTHKDVLQHGKPNKDVTISKTGTGSYLIKGLTKFRNASATGAEYHTLNPTDSNGSTLMILQVKSTGADGIAFTTHLPRLDAQTGKISAGAAKDIPDDPLYWFMLNAE